MVESLFGKLSAYTKVNKKKVLIVFKKIMKQEPNNEEEKEI